MSTKKSLLFLISLLLMVSCASQKPLWPVPTEDRTSLTSTAAIPLEQIPPAATLPPTHTSDLPSLNASTQIQPAPEVAWSDFHSDTYRCSFEYPAAYDEPQYQTCSPRVVEQPDNGEFSMGHQSYLYVQRKDNLDIQSYVDNLVAQKQDDGAWVLVSQDLKIVGGEEAVEINYRFGGTNRFGTATILNHNGLLLMFNFYAGASCDVQEINLTEQQAYAHWIESLQFDG